MPRRLCRSGSQARAAAWTKGAQRAAWLAGGPFGRAAQEKGRKHPLGSWPLTQRWQRMTHECQPAHLRVYDLPCVCGLPLAAVQALCWLLVVALLSRWIVSGRFSTIIDVFMD